jgi:hypothetical protein
MTDTTTFDPAAAYADVWRRYSHNLKEGRGKVDLDGPEGPIYTLVSRLPGHVGGAALEALGSTSVDWSPHYTYPLPEVHVTILFITPYLALEREMETAEEERVVRSACAPLRRVFDRHPPLRFEAAGLNLFATTVFLQLLQQVPAAPRRLRHELASSLKSQAGDVTARADYESTLAWDLAFANLVRFRRPATPEVVSAVSSLRNVHFGEITLREVELVRTDKLLSKAKTKTIERFSFGRA